MGSITSTKSWKLVFRKGLTIKGEIADLFKFAWLSECEQKGIHVKYSTFLLDIIRLGLGEYLRMVEMNAQIRIARAEKERQHDLTQ